MQFSLSAFCLRAAWSRLSEFYGNVPVDSGRGTTRVTISIRKIKNDHPPLQTREDCFCQLVCQRTHTLTQSQLHSEVILFTFFRINHVFHSIYLHQLHQPAAQFTAWIPSGNKILLLFFPPDGKGEVRQLVAQSQPD